MRRDSDRGAHGATGPLPVSVVIPAYNRADMIRRAVVSALEQRPQPPAEVIVVDDASSDDTAARAEAAGARVIRHEVNRGEGGARNTGIAAATQPWIALLDSDDEWLPHHLAQLWLLREDHVLVADAMLVCGADPQADRLHGPAADRPVTLRSPAALIFPQNFVNPSATMFRRDVSDRIEGYGTSFGGTDLDYLLRLLEHGTGVVTPVVGGLYHVHEGQMTADIRAFEESLRSLVASFAGRPWFRPELLEALGVVHAWDDLRRSRNAGDDARVRAAAGWILRHPRRVGALIRMWWWRLGLRRRSGLTARDGRGTVAVLPGDAANPDAIRRARTMGAVVTLPDGVGRRRAALRLLRRPTRMAVASSPWDRLWLGLAGIRSVKP